MTKRLIDIPRGKVFKFRGMDWISLERTEQGGILTLSKDIVCEMPFDKDNCNNYAKSSIRKYLNGEFADKIGVNSTDFLPYELDLTADDGTTYGKCKDRIFLMTTDIYRRNRDVIDPIDEWWWTATAYSANAAYSFGVRYVHSGGTLHYNNACSGNGGVRPLCNLSSDTLVQINGEDEDNEVISADKAGEITKELFEERSLEISENQFRLAIAVTLNVLVRESKRTRGCARNE